jgi:hypothetical protein
VVIFLEIVQQLRTLGCFARNLGVTNACLLCWNYIYDDGHWNREFEVLAFTLGRDGFYYCYSIAFKNATMVPWQLCNRWLNCVELIKMSFIISHIYRESNQCADGIVNLGLHIPRSQWWDTIPFVNLVCSSAHFFPSSGFFLWVLQVRFLMRQLYISQALTWILV